MSCCQNIDTTTGSLEVELDFFPKLPFGSEIDSDKEVGLLESHLVVPIIGHHRFDVTDRLVPIREEPGPRLS